MCELMPRQAKQPLAGSETWLTLRLAIWDVDDLMEYLLAKHKTRCGAILAELRQTGNAWQLQGIPELWTITLDFLAGQPAVLPVLKALRVAFMEKVTGVELIHAAGDYGLACVLKDVDAAAKPRGVLGRADNALELLRLVRHAPLQQALAVGRIACDLEAGEACRYLQARLPRPMVREVAEQIRNQPAALAQLKHFLSQADLARHPMAASICHQLDRQWLRAFSSSEQTPLPSLARAYLDHANWPGVVMVKAALSEADLSFANLLGASLAKAVAWRTDFHGAVLTRADLHELVGSEANFSRTDMRDVKAVSAELSHAVFRETNLDGATFFRAKLQQADFTGASLVKALLQEAILDGIHIAEADLTGADFSGASLGGSDFRTAQINGTRWGRASIVECNFEELSAWGVDFSEAALNGTLFTASTLPGADFHGADLRNTGLADIDWEGANLHNADLRGASFHLGSSRSGLVGSPIAREGSMTGFYTDEFTEQDFKAPEEIRKANLCNADLRGANIDGVDFYLVDLRDAQYDEEQAAQFRACGAILHHR